MHCGLKYRRCGFELVWLKPCKTPHPSASAQRVRSERRPIARDSGRTPLRPSATEDVGSAFVVAAVVAIIRWRLVTAEVGTPPPARRPTHPGATNKHKMAPNNPPRNGAFGNMGLGNYFLARRNGGLCYVYICCIVLSESCTVLHERCVVLDERCTALFGRCIVRDKRCSLLYEYGDVWH